MHRPSYTHYINYEDLYHPQYVLRLISLDLRRAHSLIMMKFNRACSLFLVAVSVTITVEVDYYDEVPYDYEWPVGDDYEFRDLPGRRLRGLGTLKIKLHTLPGFPRGYSSKPTGRQGSEGGEPEAAAASATESSARVLYRE